MKKILTVILLVALSTMFLAQYSGAAPELDGGIEVKVFNDKYNSFSYPRPFQNSVNVPLRTSYYIRLVVPDNPQDKIKTESVNVKLTAPGEDTIILINDGKFSQGCSGSIGYIYTLQDGDNFDVFIETNEALKPSTKYTINLSARTNGGRSISEKDGTWSFTTADKAQVYDIEYNLDLNADLDVKWTGQLFSGTGKSDFASTEHYGTDRFDFMFSDEMKDEYPNAWNLFRLHRITGFDYANKQALLPTWESNFVREMETRRIVSVEDKAEGTLLKVEDFFGHEQYGVESNRPLSKDYREGDEILVADGTNSERAFVISTDDAKGTVLVTKLKTPANKWLLNYYMEPPTEEYLKSPGLFTYGGAYLRKFNPVGTPVYYWDRLDHEIDIIHGKYGQRIIAGFIEAPGDLSIDGSPFTTAKDYAQLHQVTYDTVSHLIDRYKDATLDWVWSIFNEPDIQAVYWRNKDWIELQKFYDYSVDAILKAFEDKGYDSNDVFIGGLELGGIFGPNLRLEDFLAHCSPTAVRDSKDFLGYNAAYADKRLDGKRSKRVEDLCRANSGKGTPIDFISVHTYNNSKIAADKLIRAKQKALEVDPEYYEDLWINSFESMPNWSDFYDKGASEWALGNGYLTTWASDYINRILQQAKIDPRYAYGESIYTIKTFIASNFEPLNDVVARLSVGTGRNIRKEIVPRPIFHFTSLLSTMGNNYWVFPRNEIGGHTVSGFASPTGKDIRMVLYSHDTYDAQSRSDNSFNVKVKIDGLSMDEVTVTEYQFDRVNNTFYPAAQKYGRKTLFTEKQFEEIKEMSKLKVSNVTTCRVKDGELNIEVPVAANGANFVIISESGADDLPVDSPVETPDKTPAETPDQSQTPDETQNETPGDPTDKAPSETMTNSDENSTSDDSSSKKDSPATDDNGISYIILLMLLSGLLVLYARKNIINDNGK